jgi:hypothetical protein
VFGVDFGQHFFRIPQNRSDVTQSPANAIEDGSGTDVHPGSNVIFTEALDGPYDTVLMLVNGPTVFQVAVA